MHEVADHGIYGYSFQASVPEYYDSIISWYRRRFGVTLQRDWLMFSNGTVEAVAHAVRAFTNVGDGVILCRPVYGHFTGCIEEECYRKVVNSQLICQDGYYTVDWADFEQKCAVPTNRLFVLCSPANPVGRVWSPEELQRMYEICKRHHVLMLSDEIHCDIILKGHRHTTMLSATDDYSNLIVVSGINKTFNVAGLSCSTVIIPDATLRGVFQKDFGMRPITPFAIGALIGLGVTKGRVPPFIITLGVMNIVRSVAQYFTKSYKTEVPKEFQVLANKEIIGGQMLLPILYWVVLAIIMYVISKHTAFGRHIYAVGSNERTSRLSGINVDSWKVAVYTLSGFFIGMAGIFYAAAYTTITPGTGNGLEMNGITGVIIGGTSMSGGSGTMVGTLIGVFIMSVLKTGLSACGLQAPWQTFLTGAVVIGAVLLDKARTNAANRVKKV